MKKLDASKLQKAHAAACFRQAAEKALLSIVERFAISTILFPCKHLHMGVVGIEIHSQLIDDGKSSVFEFIVNIRVNSPICYFDSLIKPIKLFIQKPDLALRVLIERMQLVMQSV